MTHEELIDKINILGHTSSWAALRAVVELHKPHNPQPLQPEWFLCEACDCGDPYLSPEYPCPTIQTIEKELS